MTAVIWPAIVALLVGILLILGGRRSLRERRLTDAKTLGLDTRGLSSQEHRLAGRPDRLSRDGEFIIPEEWNSSRRVFPSHRAQLGAYLILVEEEYGIRPPYGVIVTGEGHRHQVENSEQLRGLVLGVADRIREARRQLAEPIPVQPSVAQCRPCGMREGCGQRRA